MKRRLGWSLILLSTAGCALWLGWGAASNAQGQDAPVSGITLPDGFWAHWGDGRAELAGYDLSIVRYGQPRTGTAVAITVTEDFHRTQRVKHDGRRGPETVPVVKLNLVKDFATGIYDYNLMLSAFVALEPAHGHGPGHPSKLSFSCQEWCGHVYHHLRFDPDAVRQDLHSYFQSEGDSDAPLERPRGGIAEDVVLLWARGLAAPDVAPGAHLDAPVLRSLQTARLNHRPLDWSEGRFARAAETSSVTVPAGTFEVRRATLDLGGRRGWSVDVEVQPPHRIVRWISPAGETGELTGSDRLAYWQLNQEGRESQLQRLGLAPRPPRTP